MEWIEDKKLMATLEAQVMELQERNGNRLLENHDLKKQVRELQEQLQSAKDDLKELDGACWHCLHPDSGDPERHEHEPEGGHWHHYIDPGDGLPSPCENSDLLERIFQASEEREKRLREALTNLLVSYKTVWMHDKPISVSQWEALPVVKEAEQALKSEK